MPRLRLLCGITLAGTTSLTEADEMPGFELLKGVRDLNAILDDYRPKKWRGSQFESGSPQNRAYNDCATIYEESIGRHLEGDNLECSGMSDFRVAPFSPPMKSANFNGGQRGELGHSRLDEIAKAIRTLTYGEMLELAESMWKVKSHAEITESDLPAVLHRWSASQR
jgi:hypothetical protein